MLEAFLPFLFFEWKQMPLINEDAIMFPRSFFWHLLQWFNECKVVHRHLGKQFWFFLTCSSSIWIQFRNWVLKNNSSQCSKAYEYVVLRDSEEKIQTSAMISIVLLLYTALHNRISMPPNFNVFYTWECIADFLLLIFSKLCHIHIGQVKK